MVASGYPSVIRIGPANKQYVYHATTTAIGNLPVYRCGKAADNWPDTEGEVLYLLPLRPGWKAVHYHKEAVPGDVNTGNPVFSTYADAAVPGKFMWLKNTADRGEEAEWEELAMFVTVVIPES